MKKGLILPDLDHFYPINENALGAETVNYNRPITVDGMGVSDIYGDLDTSIRMTHNIVEENIVLTPDKLGAVIWIGPHNRAYLDYPLEFLYERVWLLTTDIDAGFITETQDYNIVLWNAFQSTSKSITAIVATGATGTTLTYPTLPDIVTQTWTVTYPLQVLKLGPPTQETIYTFTFGGEDLDLEITGIRVLPVEPDPQWDAGIKDVYEYQTSMFSNQRHTEQRRPLTDKPERKLIVKYLLDNNAAHRFSNYIMYGHDKLFAVPFYREKMVPSSIATTLITLSSDIQYLWNLNNFASYVFIADHLNEIYEIKEIDSIDTGAGTITLTRSVTETYTDLNNTFVYPAFLGIVASVSFDSETDNVETIDVEFREYFG